MPVIINGALPAKSILEEENIFVMTAGRAIAQEIRPLNIGILNLMPNKEETELQLLRLIGNTPLQVEVSFLRTASYSGTHTSETHLDSFYTTLDEVKRENKKFDGFIITGAPVEKLDFSDVKYWDELKDIMDWAEENVYSTFYICWAAQAAMYYFYNVQKREFPKKISGVFLHETLKQSHPLMRNFDDYFYAPHSRHTEVIPSQTNSVEDIEILATSDEAGIFIAASKDGRRVFVFGHAEYDKFTLDKEYKRDVAAKRGDVEAPAHYYDKDGQPVLNWRAHSSLLFANWLNYFVYQNTPYNIGEIKKKV